MNTRKITLFLLITFALSWAIAFSYIGFVGDFASPFFTLALLGMMWMPGIAAIIVQRGIYKEPLGAIGLNFKLNRWIAVAWLLPIVFTGLTVLFNGLMPGVELNSGLATLNELLTVSNVPEAQIEQIMGTLSQLGVFLPIILFVGFMLLNLVGGITINALFAMGEELGWRGLLQNEMAPLGFWRMNLVIGVLWGIWHAPIIWQGYNYPQHPQWGVLMMVAFTILLSPLHAIVRDKSGTLLAPAILHGTINASGGVAVFFKSGGNDLTVGIVGAAGLLALVLMNVALWWWMSNNSGQPEVTFPSESGDETQLSTPAA